MGRLLRRIPRLSLQLFLLILVCVIFPIYLMLHYLRGEFEDYMREEISGRVIQSISKSEEEIYQVFRNMASISTAIASNEQLIDILTDDSATRLQRTIAFDSAIANMTVNNLFTVEEIMFTLFDLDDHIHSNWGIHYNDYSFLLQQDWVQESIRQNGHIIWSMFSPGYIIPTWVSHQEDYISLARSILHDGISRQRVGTLIISIEQNQLRKALEKYMYNSTDRIYVCADGGDIILRHDDGAAERQEQVRGVFSQIKAPSGSLIIETDGKQYLVSYYTISSPWTFNGQRLRVLHYTDYAGVISQVEAFSRNAQISALLFVILLLLLTGIISLRVERPIRYLEQEMGKYAVGSEIHGLDISRRDEIGKLNRAFITMSEHITDLFASLEKEHEVRERYRFESLRAQLNPHFLFNTLGSIRWMAIMRGADNMVEVIDALAGMLKYTMKRGGDLARLEEEIQSVRDYVFIQKMRYGNRCTLEIDIPSFIQQRYVVKFILQPIVENAILHGLKDNGKSGIIRIWAEAEPDSIKLFVEDNGKGIPPITLEKLNDQDEAQEEKRVTGIGFGNVHQRIRNIYGPPYGLTVDSSPGHHTTVIYTLPVLEEGNAQSLDDDKHGEDVAGWSE